MKRREEIRNILEDILSQRIVILDGAMGTMIQSYGLSENDFRGKLFSDHKINLKGNNDLLSITKPEIIREIHHAYLEAGADIIKTNTINANGISQSEYGLSHLAYEINRQSALIAVEETKKMSSLDKPRFVAGVIGPTSKMLSVSPDVNEPTKRAITFDELVDIYLDAIKGLFDGGVDLFLIETIFDTLNCKAAIFALYKFFDAIGYSLPIMLSATLADTSGRMLAGQTAVAFACSVLHAKPLSIGLNCAFGPRVMYPYLEELSRKFVDINISLHPNAGLPDAFGKYNETPEMMAEVMKEYAKEGLLNIAGGCCGTTPLHIKCLYETLKDLSPRKLKSKPQRLFLSGLEPLFVDSSSLFVNIGERTNVAGSAKFAELIRHQEFEKALEVAREQVENGAQIIDINMDDPMVDAVEAMKTFLMLLSTEPDICKIPFMIDSSRWEVIEESLKCIQGKPIVNAISLKDGETLFIEKAKKISRYGAAIVVMAFDEDGQAESYDRKISICKRAYYLLTEKAKIDPSDIIFDPNVFAIGTGIEAHRKYGIDFINAVRELKRLYPSSSVSGGISNVSFSFRGNNTIRKAINSIFLYHAINAGLDMGIVNPAQLSLYDDIDSELKKLIEDLIFDRRDDAAEKLLEFKCDKESKPIQKDTSKNWRTLPVEERLVYAIVNGIADFIEEDTKEFLSISEDPVKVIEGPLMKGMNKVGELFGNGKMFLPQVIKSARVMKLAVNVVAPYLKKGDNKLSTKGKIIIATVKGDVHDIGKNIVSLVLQCNGWEVIDLGVMVPASTIIAKVKENNVNIVGLSGLITPSLEEMCIVAKEMEQEKLEIPLLIGGATTSKVHTAVKIAPCYRGPVIYVKDASNAPQVCSRLLHPQLRRQYVTSVKHEQNTLYDHYIEREKKVEIVPLEIARKNKYKNEWKDYRPPKPNLLCKEFLLETTVEKIRDYIDWSHFFHSWGFTLPYPEVFFHSKEGEEAEKLFKDTTEILDDLNIKKLIKPKGIVKFLPANTFNFEEVRVFTDDTRKESIGKFFFLRQQVKKNEEQTFYSLADFIAPIESNLMDYIGIFVVTAGDVSALSNHFSSRGEEYKSVIIRLIADRIAEALSEYLHLIVRKELWGYSPDENLSIDEIFKGKYCGIRPAPGYPATPDHSAKELIFDILSVKEKLGLNLTENYSIYPPSSVCGFYFSHPKSQYFSIGRIGKDQIQQYADSLGVSTSTAERNLGLVMI